MLVEGHDGFVWDVRVVDSQYGVLAAAYDQCQRMAGRVPLIELPFEVGSTFSEILSPTNYCLQLLQICQFFENRVWKHPIARQDSRRESEQAPLL